jgi:transposase-like protein
MKCPECESPHIQKNGKRKGKQNYICVLCRRQFIDDYEPHRGYSDSIRQDCLKMYVDEMGFRAILKSQRSSSYHDHYLDKASGRNVARYL